MAVKYHINPEKGALVCDAKTPDKCHYGSDAPHFASRDEAKKAWEKDLSNEFKNIHTSVKKTGGRSALRGKEWLQQFEEQEVESIIEFANESINNYKLIRSTIDNRTNATKEKIVQLDDVNPFNPSCSKSCNELTFKSMKRDLEDYRNKTAELVEAATESNFYSPLYHKLENDEKIGNAVKTESFASNTVEWLKERSNTIGGSDVGAYTSLKYSEKPAPWTKGNFEKIEKSKSGAISDKELEEQAKRQAVVKTGAMYRGTVWESMIRNSYAEDHPEMKVYEAKGQYVNPDRTWQKINVDAVLSDREDGKPNGILEIKTSSDASHWKDGIPLEYRSQTLYYLNATGLEYSDIRVLFNDSVSKDFRLNKNDEVVPGKGFTMDEFIKSDIEPWFNNLKTKREAA